MNYSEAITYLYTSQPAFHLVGSSAYKPGLDNTYQLMAHLGNPHEQLRCIHIAGTNGKGSTSHLIAAALLSAGLKVGLYTSPHLVDFRERIRIFNKNNPTEKDGGKIPEDAVTQFVEKNRIFLDTLHPSFFETTMAMAFSYFAEQQVDIAVIEVGLGGRLDSTNIITPLLSVITNIGFDHTEFLGNTLPAIAQEKAGIIKPCVPVVIGETHPETAPVFIEQAHRTGSEIIFADQQEQPPITECQLKGIYQEKNIRTAYSALQRLSTIPPCTALSTTVIRKGFAEVCNTTGLRGRWEKLSDAPLTICDTGHNSHGIQYVAQQLSMFKPSKRLHIVFGMVNDKDVDVVLQLLPQEALYFWTQAQTHRAIAATTLQQMGEHNGLHGTSYSTVWEAITDAEKEADIVFIGGSNYVVGEAIPYYEKAPKTVS